METTHNTHDLAARMDEAVRVFGYEIVSEAITLVEFADADAAYIQFSDMGMYEHAEVIEIVYFD